MFHRTPHPPLAHQLYPHLSIVLIQRGGAMILGRMMLC